VLTAATPAATAAFLATRLTFGRRVFFVFVGLFALVVFLVFDLLRARFSNDLAFVRLTLFFMIPPVASKWLAQLWRRPNFNSPGVAAVPPPLPLRRQLGNSSAAALPRKSCFLPLVHFSDKLYVVLIEERLDRFVEISILCTRDLGRNAEPQARGMGHTDRDIGT
jgi:hypothetical protein